MKAFLEALGGALVLECRSVFASKKALAVFVVMPVCWIVLMLGLFNEALIRDLPFGIVNLDKSALSLEIESRVASLPSTTPLAFASTEEAFREARAGRIAGYLLVPARFATRLGTPESEPVQLFFNKTFYPKAVTNELEIKSALLEVVEESFAAAAMTAGLSSREARAAVHLIAINHAAIGNVAFNFQTYLLATLIPGILQLVCVLAVITRFIATRKEAEVLPALPETAAKVLFASMLYWCMAALAILYVAFVLGLDPGAGNLALLLGSYALLFVVIGISGVFAAAVFAPLNPVFAWIAGIVYCAPIYPFTGFSYPFESMGVSAALFGEALPLTHLIRAQGALLFMQEPTPVFARAVVAMAFFGVLFAALAHLGTLFWGRFKRP